MREELSGVRVSENGDSESKWLKLGWITETLVLRAVFWGLLAGAVTIAALDYSALYQRANPVLPGEETQRTPVVMEPPKQRDHVRPYLPRAMPKLQRGDGRQDRRRFSVQFKDDALESWGGDPLPKEGGEDLLPSRPPR